MGCCVCIGTDYEPLSLDEIKFNEEKIGRIPLGSKSVYSTDERAFTRKHSKRIKVESVSIVVNPYSGNGLGRKSLTALTNKLAGESIEIRESIETQYKGHTMEIGRDHDFGDIDLVIIIGGDGTFQEFLSGYMQRKTQNYPLLLCPGGTGNSLARSLGIFVNREVAYDDIIKQIKIGNIQSMDVNWFESKDFTGPSVNCIVFGFGADLNERAEGCCCRNCCGHCRYRAAAYSMICCPYSKEVKVTAKDEKGNEVSSEGKVNALMFQHNSELGSAEIAAPFAALDDGHMDLVSVGADCSLRIIPVYEGMSSKTHLDNSLVEYYRMKSVRVGGKGVVNIDGNNIGSTPFTVSVKENALELCHTATELLDQYDKHGDVFQEMEIGDGPEDQGHGAEPDR